MLPKELIDQINELDKELEKTKSMPRRPIEYMDHDGDGPRGKIIRTRYDCPLCNHRVYVGSDCENCGQRLDWR